MALFPNQAMPASKTAAAGVVLVSGVKTVILGPTRVDPYFNKGFGVFNHGNVPITVNVEINFDMHGGVAHVGSAGAVDRVDPNPAYWVDISDAAMTVAASGAAACQVNTPCPWIRLVATNPNTQPITVSGFMHALSQ